MMGRGDGPPWLGGVGLVLAGGESRRLGRDKARLDGAALPRLAAERLAAVCAEVAVADRGRELVPGRPSLPDGVGRGPAAGILGGAAAYPACPSASRQRSRNVTSSVPSSSRVTRSREA